ncbi:ras-GEF domain-containing family member 1B-B-like, partial [Manduca sexta]
MVRGNKFMSENTCKHIVMNGGINFVSTQKVEAPQLSVLTSGGKTIATLPYCSAEKLDIQYRDGHIISATLDTLVDMLRPGTSKSFTFTFLLCSRLFVKPHELLNKLCKRYFKTYDKIGKGEVKDLVEKELNDMIALVRVLSQWTSMFPYDFRDDRVMALVRSITQ